MVLQVYCDDSGTGGRGQHDVFVLGGWLADSNAWAGFAADWAAALSEPPSIAYFKMNEARVTRGQLRGQFKDWPHKARDEKVSRLAAIVKKYARLGIHFRLSHNEYRSSIRGKFLKELDDPYFAGFYGFICGVIRFLKDEEIINARRFHFRRTATSKRCCSVSI
jgi:hypothetical protein